MRRWPCWPRCEPRARWARRASTSRCTRSSPARTSSSRSTTRSASTPSGGWSVWVGPQWHLPVRRRSVQRRRSPGPTLGRVPRDARAAGGARRSGVARSVGPARALPGAGATIAELVRNRSREDLVARGQAVGLPCGILHRPTGFVADRQLASRGTFVATPTPWGEVPMPVPGAGFRATPSLVRARTSAPAPPASTTWPGGAPRIDRASSAGTEPGRWQASAC